MPSTTPQSRRAAATRMDRANASRPPQRSAGAIAARGRADVCEVQVVDLEKVALARAALPKAATVTALAETLRALGDPTRLLIVCALAADRVDELCVCDLATLVGVSDSAVSHSLRTLRQLGVVRYRKAGKIAYYALDDAHVANLVRSGVRHLERVP